MPILLPSTVDEACSLLDASEDAVVLAGGTDLMVEVNSGRRRPGTVVALRAIGLDTWTERDVGGVPTLVLGAGVTYTELMAPPLARLVPSLAMAARTVGSPQIRNAGTIGGNVATASPAGDTLPVLAALDASVELTGAGGRRHVRLTDFIVGPKRTIRQRDELITAIHVPLTIGPQEFLKIGTRNAMVISVVSLAAIADVRARTLRVAAGAAAPVPLRARAAEAWVRDRLDWDGLAAAAGPAAVDEALATEFGDRVASEVSPIDDHRSTEQYRRHAAGVLARRALVRLWRR